MKTVYWIATVLLCLILLFTGYLDMARNPQMLSGMATLGYPEAARRIYCKPIHLRISLGLRHYAHNWRLHRRSI